MNARFRPALIAVVDEPADYGLLAEPLAAAGIELHFSPQGAVAHAHCCVDAGDPPDALLVNVRAVSATAGSLVPALRDRYPGVPVCLVSDRGTIEDEILARCSGADVYFPKPLCAELLSALVEVSRRVDADPSAHEVEAMPDSRQSATCVHSFSTMFETTAVATSPC